MKNSKPVIIGIAGGSGSGKTFFLHSFLHHFKTDEVTLISQDDYYIPPGEMTQEENKLYNFDLPTTIDSQQFVMDLKKLRDVLREFIIIYEPFLSSTSSATATGLANVRVSVTDKCNCSRL